MMDAILSQLSVALTTLSLLLNSPQATVLLQSGTSVPTEAESPNSAVLSLELSGQQWQIDESFEATVTAYSSSPDETWGDPYISADGNRVYDGLVACPRRYPFGTHFLIDDQIYRCGDRLAKRFDDRLDVWKSSKQLAINWGKRTIKVFKLSQVDQQETHSLSTGTKTENALAQSPF